MTTCPLCDEEVEPDDVDVRPVGDWTIGGPVVAHRACLLRNVLGGWGHHVDHAYWCVERGDPDGGLSYRESALRVDALVSARGTRG